jgi:threonine synthase
VTAAADGGSRPFQCANCRRPYPPTGLPHICPQCGGVYEFAAPLIYRPIDASGIERYRQTFPLPDGAPLVSLGEGNTPLIFVELAGRSVHLKCDYLNPTGSFKDRGSAVLLSWLQAEGVTEVVEDSSGNAGASLAGYAARAGIAARIFIPDYAAGPKRAQIEAYGAEVVRILGPRSAAAEAVLNQVEQGAVYASHAHLPHGLAGMATLAFELYEQLGMAPGAVILPVGQGTLMLGAHLGFEALRSAGRIEALPQWVAVQALACAPLWGVLHGGAAGLLWTKERETVAEGIRILRPHRGDAILRAIGASGGRAAAVEEEEIRQGRAELARRGFLVEPTSAVVWPALVSEMAELPDPIVVVLTGAGYKDMRQEDAG